MNVRDTSIDMAKLKTIQSRRRTDATQAKQPLAACVSLQSQGSTGDDALTAVARVGFQAPHLKASTTAASEEKQPI